MSPPHGFMTRGASHQYTCPVQGTCSPKRTILPSKSCTRQSASQKKRTTHMSLLEVPHALTLQPLVASVEHPGCVALYSHHYHVFPFLVPAIRALVLLAQTSVIFENAGSMRRIHKTCVHSLLGMLPKAIKEINTKRWPLGNHCQGCHQHWITF